MKKNIFYLMLIIFLAIFLFPQLIQAQGITNPVIGNLGTNEASASSGGKFVEYTVYLWRAAIAIGSLAVIVYFLLGAFTWITSGGDKTKVEEARNKISTAIIGLIVLAATIALFNLVASFLGITTIKFI